MALRGTLCALLSVSLCWSSMASSIYYVDTPSSSFLHSKSQLDTMSVPLYTALASSVMGLRPSTSISIETSQQLNAILKPSPFHHPKMFLSVNILGASGDLLEVLKRSFKGSSIKSFDSSNVDAPTVLNSLAQLSANNKGAKFTFLGATHVQAPAADLEADVKAWAAGMGVSYVAGTVPLSGKVHLGEDIVLDCTVEEEKAVVLDIAHLYTQLQLAASQTASANNEVASVVSLTITSLHGLSLKYGADSAKYTEALEAVLAMISSTLQQQKALAESTIVQVASVSLASTETATTILNTMHRSLKQARADDPSTLRSKQFSIKAAAYGSFLLLLYFTFAGIYCMCTMKFKEDSLLFPRTKQE